MRKINYGKMLYSKKKKKIILMMMMKTSRCVKILQKKNGISLSDLIREICTQTCSDDPHASVTKNKKKKKSFIFN